MSRQTIVDKIMSILEGKVLSGEILPHQKISELEIAKSLGISRSPVREAFIHLEERGLFERIRGGRRIKEITEEDVREISEVIVMIETFCAFKAIEQEFKEYLSELKGILSQLEDSIKNKEKDKYIKFNYEFHDTIIRASGNKVLISLYQDFVRRFRWTSFLNYTEYMDHRRIFEALRKGDKEKIAQLILEHRKSFLETLLSKIKYLKKFGATSIKGLTFK